MEIKNVNDSLTQCSKEKHFFFFLHNLKNREYLVYLLYFGHFK